MHFDDKTLWSSDYLENGYLINPFDKIYLFEDVENYGRGKIVRRLNKTYTSIRDTGIKHGMGQNFGTPDRREKKWRLIRRWF